MLHQPRRKQENPLRVIRTARTEKAINEAVREGFTPLVKPLEKAPEVYRTYTVLQHPQTGKIMTWSLTEPLPENTDYEVVIASTSHYPYSFPSPYAAYLLPSDLQKGEKVFLEDLIEDRAVFKVGQPSRAVSSVATWNGKDFDLPGDRIITFDHIIG